MKRLHLPSSRSRSFLLRFSGLMMYKTYLWSMSETEWNSFGNRWKLDPEVDR